MSAVLPIELTLYGQQVQNLSVPIGSTVSWVLHLQITKTRLPLDLTSGNVIMSLSTLDIKGNPQHPPLFAHQGDIQGDPTLGNVNIGWLDGDTAPTGSELAPGNYGIDIWTTDVDGNRLQNLGTAVIALTAVGVYPSTPITPLPSQVPLAQGPAGAAIVWRGAYDALTTYAPLDAVDYASGGATSSYICTAGTTGHVPTNATYWDLMASGEPPSALPDPSAFPNGAVPVVRSGAWVYDTRLTQDDIDPGFSISSMSGGGGYASTKEVGDTVVNPSFTIGYSATPTSATINDGTGAKSLTTPFTSFAYSGGNATTYTKTAIGAAVTWLLTAIFGTTKTASVSATWLPRVFYDVATPGTFNAAFIAALTGQGLAGSFARTIAFGSAGGTKKLYYAFPTAFGAPSHFTDTGTGFSFPFSKVASAVAVTNGFSVVTNYDVWASDNFVNAATTIQVS